MVDEFFGTQGYVLENADLYLKKARALECVLPKIAKAHLLVGFFCKKLQIKDSYLDKDSVVVFSRRRRGCLPKALGWRLWRLVEPFNKQRKP